jgi:hypothetical protein
MTHPAPRGIPTRQRVNRLTSANLWAGSPGSQPRSSLEAISVLGCGRCPVDLVIDARYARYNVAGVRFPVGLSSLRLLTVHVLSQAWLLSGLHRASPVPFRGSYFTSGLHPPDATPQRLIACLYRRWGFPPITSLCFVAHNSNRTSRKLQK